MAEHKSSLRHRLYHGETAFDFVGRTRTWFVLSGAVILIGLLSLFTRGLNLGIDFKGGLVWEVRAPHTSVSKARSELRPIGLAESKIQILQPPTGPRLLRVQANAKDRAKRDEVTRRLEKLGPVESVTDVGPSWGHDVTKKAERALVVFFVLISIYISLRFEWKMALAAIIAVIHDILVTVGVYSISGFSVTPATIVAFLTILGYSLYDTVVVFDKVGENTRGLAASGRLTYGDTVNLSMNQVLMRSLNTSLVAILPVLSVLVIGAYALGATALQDFGLALLVGLLTGAYSSIFVASPVLAMLKEREPRYAAIRQRQATRGAVAGGPPLTPAAAAAMAGTTPAASDGGDGARVGARATTSGRPRPAPAARQVNRPPPRPRKKGKRR